MKGICISTEPGANPRTKFKGYDLITEVYDAQ